jgi:hypothetical protein
VLILSAAASDGSPAYVSGLLENNTTDACTGWLEDSVNGGAWTNVSPQVTLAATNQGLVNYPWVRQARPGAVRSAPVALAVALACHVRPPQFTQPPGGELGLAVTVKTPLKLRDCGR